MTTLTASLNFFDILISFFIRKQTEIIVKPLAFDGKGLGFSNNLQSFLHLGFSVFSIQTKHSQLCKIKIFRG